MDLTGSLSIREFVQALLQQYSEFINNDRKVPKNSSQMWLLLFPWLLSNGWSEYVFVRPSVPACQFSVLFPKEHQGKVRSLGMSVSVRRGCNQILSVLKEDKQRILTF
jgi:hypothetical protein